MSKRIDRIKNNMPYPTGYGNPIVKPGTTDVKKNLANYIAPVQLQRTRQDVASHRAVLDE